MNNKRRVKLQVIAAKISDICDEIDSVYEEEADCMNNMPENLQGSDRYAQSEDICEQLYECAEMLNDIIDIINDIVVM